jgi:radical SAM/Cys-rich protein
MTCAHCHQSCSPSRAEEMPETVFEDARAAAARLRPALVDLTGGAPELHPRIREMVDALASDGHAVQLRTNLTALLLPECADLPGFLSARCVRLIASLPSLDAHAFEDQRGAGSFEASIEAMRVLNALGYGAGDGLVLDIAHNPPGVELPEDQETLEARFRTELALRFGVSFDRLVASTNVPVGRFRARLRAARAEAAYLDALRCAFNPDTVGLISCRDQAVVAWDGTLWDCDYNLGAGLPPRAGTSRTVSELDESFATRRIAFGPHCFACTAAAGSS